jgi:hypothetical protein
MDVYLVTLTDDYGIFARRHVEAKSHGQALERTITHYHCAGHSFKTTVENRGPYIPKRY